MATIKQCQNFGEKKQEVIGFLETLEEDDDVQSVYSNVEFEN